MAFVAISCSESGRPGARVAMQPRHGSFDSLFRRVRLVTLEESDSTLITGIERIAVREADGVWAIPDRIEAAVRVYTPSGALLHDLGRFGDGPGEFRLPRGVTFASDGSLLVADWVRPRLTRFGPSFAYDTSFNINVPAIFPVVAWGPNILIGEDRFREDPAAPYWAVYDGRGRRRDAFHPLPAPLFENPYWRSVVGNETNSHTAVVLRDRIIVANALLYPLVAYEPGTWKGDSIGTPPPSWIPVPRVEPGHFRPPRQIKDFNRWRRSFSTIDGVYALRDSLLVVAHKSFTRDSVEDSPLYHLDMYDAAYRKVLEDVRLPGRLLGIGDGLLIQLDGPPNPWTVGVFVPARVADDG
ncbi:MAG: 6-bladed beta-propeller [Gemmatimonadota bacterium]